MSKFTAALAMCLLITGMVLAPFPGVVEAASTKDDSSSNKGKSFENGKKAFETADWQIAIDHFKKAVAEAVIEKLEPIQKKFRELTVDRRAIRDILRHGTERVAPIAENTMKTVRERVGLHSY